MNDQVEILPSHQRFIKSYLEFQNSIIAQFENENEIQKQELFELVYNIFEGYLIKKFLNGNKFEKLFLPSILNGNNTHVQQIQIEFKKQEDFFERNFKFKNDEQLNDKDYITPKILSDIFENSLDSSIKQSSGSYYTSIAEVDFLCKETIHFYLLQNTNISAKLLLHLIWDEELFDCNVSQNDLEILFEKISSIQVLDPSCGTGEFIIGFLKNIIILIRKINQLLQKNNLKLRKLYEQIITSNLFGIEINNLALEICLIRIKLLLISLDSDISILDEFSNFLHFDALLDIKSIMKKINQKRFDIIIGNPPYIRQELFRNKKESNLEKLLDYKVKIINNLQNLSENTTEIPSYMKSDLYIYFFYLANILIKPKGVIGYITSNSWLDSRSGYFLREYLLKNTNVHFIAQDNCKKSFSASINTSIIVFSKPQNNQFLENESIAFISIDDSSWNEREILAELHLSQRDFFSKGKRIIRKTRNELLEYKQNSNKFYEKKWSGIFFRAPDILFKILNKIQDKLIPLKNYGKIRYPLKTGINEFFFVNNEIVEEFNIEQEFLIPVLKSPKKIRKYKIERNDLEFYLFNCCYTKEQLKNKNKIGAFSYIEWGEKQKTVNKQQSIQGIAWPKVPSVIRNTPEWYSISKITPVNIFCNRFFDRRFFFCYSEDSIIEDQTFYGIVKSNKNYPDQGLLAILNSTLIFLFLEIFGRTALGRGALQFSIEDMSFLPVFDYEKIPDKIKQQLILQFDELVKREILPIDKEICMNDRRNLDKLIFNWLNLTEDEIDTIYSSLISLVNNRIKKSGQNIIRSIQV
ncbi:MAG: Eco57I restriction-modification methylase domain-containing protein [Candidatus Thorarchaeota archaeon]